MFFRDFPKLKAIENDINAALNAIIEAYENNGKLLCCGNGGSCADCEHIVGELMKGFMLQRKTDASFSEKLKNAGCEDAEYICDNLQGALPALSLTGQSAVLSAFANDVNSDFVYAQMVYGYGNENDILLCLSTSGNSKNVVYAAKVAKAKGMTTIAMTGANESKLSEICDVTIKVPETETYKVQELHLPVYHYLCQEIEKHFYTD